MAELRVESVLREEAMAIHGGRIAEVCGEDFADKGGKAFNRCLNALDSAALCLSGGGIRSASFALGVVQALASHPRPVKTSGEVDTETAVDRAENALLARFHYLSTVSGGGYIGSWLSTWLARNAMADRNGWPEVWTALLGRRPDANDESQQMSWLRRYSNFLTPKLGVSSTDSWAAIALILRNLLLNWLVILPLVCALLLVLKLAAIVIVWFARLDPQSRADDIFFFILAGLGAVALVASLRFTTHHRPTSGHGGALDQRAFLRGGLLPATVAALLFTAAAALPYAQAMMTDAVVESGLALARVYLVLMCAGLVLYAVGWFAARRDTSGREYWGDLAAWSTAGLAFGAMTAFGLWLYAKAYYGPGFWIFEPSEILLVVLGLPWVILSQLVAEMLFVGLTSGQADSDSDREWLARAAGCALVLVLGWMLSMFFVFLGSRLMHEVVDTYWPWLSGVGAASGGLTAWLGKSSLSPAKGEAKTASGLSANVVLAIAGPLFVVILVVLLSAALDKLLLGESLLDHDLFAPRVAHGGWPSLAAAAWMIAALVVVLGLGLVASKYVNINRFSLHALYRNRLIRAFLGASNGARAPNAFTGFDEADNIRMYDLWPAETAKDGWPTVGRANWRPFHVVNIALNAVATSNLAWQERKAMPFTVSALHAGCSYIGYRNTTTYGDPQGMSVGTAMAISGAAASPNMGYHSSPSLSLLMTFLNVRLGWWLGNPGPAGDRDRDPRLKRWLRLARTGERDKIYKLEGPDKAAVPLLYEMFGKTTADWDYVYLSDGGHFENLGLYEMVRRRCRFIVVSDAGCDPKFEFDDLGNAVRKISLDLNVPIAFRGLTGLRARATADATTTAYEPPFHAVGTIDYAAADGPGAKPGIILYLKPCFHGNRIGNVGVRNYAALHEAFPHEPTGDQFFSESQFESYRALGFEMMDRVLNQALENSRLPKNPSTEDIFKLLPQTVALAP